MYRGMHPYSDTHKTLLKLGHSERTLYLQKGLIRGEQTQYWKKQDALRRAPVNMHLEPTPGLTFSFLTTIILMDLDTQKILGKEDEGK